MTVTQNTGETPKSREVSRRGALLGAASLGMGTALPLALASPAEAASYKSYAWQKTPLPKKAYLTMGSKFSYGFTPALHKEMKKAGSPEKWFKQQLNHTRVKESTAAKNVDSWWPILKKDYKAIVAANENASTPAWHTMDYYAQWCLMKRHYSKRQVFEQMVEFLENHLHVPLGDDGVFPYRVSYGHTIRKYALTNFRSLLRAATLHPAMLTSLDNSGNTKWGPNENLARELLELHTVGQGHYSEADVVNSARILTGYGVRIWHTWEPYYNQNAHYTGAVKVMGFKHANTNADGRGVALAYLDYLARHPATAEHFCRKLAQRFVSDNPSKALVNALVKSYRAHDTAIKPVLLTLVKSKEFNASLHRKIKTPTDEVVWLTRVLGMGFKKTATGSDGAQGLRWMCESLGHSPFFWPTPAGPPDTTTAWANPNRLFASMRIHLSLSGGWWPTAATYRKKSSWFPKENLRVEQWVDYMCRRIYGRPASNATVVAVCKATGTARKQRVKKTTIYSWAFPVGLAAILDLPEAYKR